MTLDDTLWERVGRLLVTRRKLRRRDLDWAFAECRRTGMPLDEVLVERGYVSRQAVASAVLLVQLGDELHAQLRERQGQSPPEVETFPDVPREPLRKFVLACVAVDAVLFGLAMLAAAFARSSSRVPLPPSAWIALFAALSLGLYWAWRLPTRRRKLRPWADALLVAGGSSVAALLVLTIRSLTGKTGVAEGLLPLWAFASVYGVCGRFAFYLAWSPKSVEPPVPVEEPRPRGRVESVPAPAPAQRALEVVRIRPDLSALLDELLAEVDAVMRERAAS